MTTAGNLRKVG
ncbi:hypothetical protein YPPY11_1420, partial [Yersinia pestis PY-11]